MVIGIASTSHSKTATAEAIFWQAIAAFVIRVRTTSPTLQNTGAQRNAALSRNSGVTGLVVNVRFWPKADMPKNAIHVAIGGKADMHLCTAYVCFDPKRTSLVVQRLCLNSYPQPFQRASLSRHEPGPEPRGRQ